MAKLIGAKVIGTSRSVEKIEKLREYGLDAGVVTGSDGFRPRDRARDWRDGVDMIVDNIGGDVFAPYRLGKESPIDIVEKYRAAQLMPRFPVLIKRSAEMARPRPKAYPKADGVSFCRMLRQNTGAIVGRSG